ncbi:unnamed protein product [Symbiodinium pilosum]|uniref:Uncharacterized protein n=1 Tax=Symbiodinium pilosum TaxID=2952 RepID=A0A812JA42_SYMPI|nr:unnamed protein product [Symbiodinium pilosum]
MIAQGPVLPSAALRSNGGSTTGGYGRSPRSGKELQSPEKRPSVPRYRSAMLDASPRSTTSGRSSPEARKAQAAKQARRQRTAMLISDRTPKAKENGKFDHSRTAMLMANKSVEDDGTQSTNSLFSMMQGKVKGLVESVRPR